MKIYNDVEYTDFQITSPFGALRSYGLHEGTDFISSVVPRKKTSILNLVRGLITKVGLHKIYGKMVTVELNLLDVSKEYPKFPKINEKIYFDYCHLHETNLKVGTIIESGAEIGKMGNTGHSLKCIDVKKDTWIPITKEEQEDPNFDLGVHLHFNVRQFKKDTKFIEYLRSINLVNPNNVFQQWSDNLFSYQCIIDFLKYLKSNK